MDNNKFWRAKSRSTREIYSDCKDMSKNGQGEFGYGLAEVWLSWHQWLVCVIYFLPGKAQGGREKSKNDTWSEKELSRHISKGSTAGSKLSKTTPGVYE